MPTGGNSCQMAKVEESSELYKSIMVHKRKKNGVNSFSQHFLVSKALVKPVEKKIWKRNPHHILVRTRSNKLCSFYVSIYQISTYRTICLSVSTRISCFCFYSDFKRGLSPALSHSDYKSGKNPVNCQTFRKKSCGQLSLFTVPWQKDMLFWQEDKKTGCWTCTSCLLV